MDRLTSRNAAARPERTALQVPPPAGVPALSEAQISVPDGTLFGHLFDVPGSRLRMRLSPGA